MSEQTELFSSGISELEMFLETSKLKYINKALKLEKYSSISKLFFYLALPGLILLIISFFISGAWILCWIYALVIIIFMSFIFTKPNKKFNFLIIIGIFAVLAFIPSNYGQSALNILSFTDPTIGPGGGSADISGFVDALAKLTENPLADLSLYIKNFIDVVNWIVFIFIIAYGVSAVGDAISFQWEKIAQKAAFIALAIVIMTLIYSLFNLADVSIRTVWDTVGSAWTDMLRKVGLSSLDQEGNIVVNVKSVVNGFFSWIPLIIPLSLFGFAFAFRKSDLKSVLFTRNILEEDTIAVEPSKFSIPIAVVLFIMGIYVIGYFLITAEPTITINPLITLIFYLFSIVTLFLIGFKVLILNKEFTLKSFTIDTLKWTILGLFGLFLWFQVFQPVAYQLDLIDTPTTLITLSQGTSVFENDILKQLFLIATPETLIFQIFPIGLGNRIYFFFRRTRIWKEEEKRLKLNRWKIAEQYRNIKINPDSVSRENLRKIVKLTVLKQKYDEITETIEKNKVQRVPYRFFIIPTIIFGLLGSFFFSWYHSFRRGIGFVLWWQNPMLGMVYFGAGFFLCLIAFFNILAAILVHAFNNVIALMLMGAS